MKEWKKALVNHFRQGIKHNTLPRLGVELEHFIVCHDTKNAVSYYGEGGVREILLGLMSHYPHAIALEEADLLGFSTDEFVITLEPASQLEISIFPMTSISRISLVYDDLCKNLNTELLPYGYEFMTVGCQPTSHVDDLPMIPKERYLLMDKYFVGTGNGGREMMRGTASLQVSIDYFSEDDFRRKIQAAYYYSPILKMLTDSSRTFEGKTLKSFLKRTDIWRRVDKARTGIVPNIFKVDYCFSDYADYIGTVPPIFVLEGKTYRYTGDRTTESLYEKKPMTEKALSHILSMAFPDVRLKNYLELRMADSVSSYLMLAYCALLKGLLYSDEGLSFAADGIRKNNLTEKDILVAEDNLMTKGYDAIVYGQPLRKIATNMLSIAEGILTQEERDFLHPFAERILHGKNDYTSH
ncbi:putative glutamate-cysteine ligase (plasmid) [Selenomonas ruminantium subsp. lactilytica TAM6421]|uniref:glutamate--cysteine ligase n=1 Tax=Selenomonas ruminantium subsp. lactilytica (strain NBRC 103574 / TAM6421) TaxID=927704 RepID=I0GUX2_SELRL|nr:glutamate-cysteine ligase family protein [Selenomonas ruminantium]BAL84559.1 putative glutamate-cysteine ligase [Selenomonas ruminantium subsp. lactilytica TAM6421]